MDFISFFKKVNASSVFDNIPDGLMVTDLNCKILLANNYAKELMAIENGQNLAEVLDVNLSIIEGLIENKIQSVFKINKGDVDVYVELSATKIESEDKFVITARNVTQSHVFMKKMMVETESSKKVNRDKNSFITRMGNDLKSPLHSIDGFSKALLEGLGGELNDKQKKYLSIINKNSQELLYIMDKIVEHSKLEAGLYNWDFTHVDSVNLLQQILRPYEEVLQQKNIDLSVNSEGIEKRICYVDENALKTIFNLLVDLAVKSGTSGRIDIQIAHPSLEEVALREIEYPENVTEKSFVMFTITDADMDLSESDLENIFDPYYQAENNKRKVTKSLSLAVVKTLIKCLHGKIWAENIDSQGLKYSFIIPNERFSY